MAANGALHTQETGSAGQAPGMPPAPDPFDRLYKQWAEHALSKNLDPPSREKWDFLTLRLLLSKDPARVARYRFIESRNTESLGADAYDLWAKMPSYMPDYSVSCKAAAELRAYERKTRGSMRRYMEAQGLSEMYGTIIESQEEFASERAAIERARARKAQTSIMIIGCAGLGFLAFMVLTVLLIIALRVL